MYRLDSIDFLRGWASVLVVISHLIGVFWINQSGLEHLMGYRSIGNISLPSAQWIIENKLFFGQFGVAIFFLISGYVITLSLERYHGLGFLVNRLVRIYPVYIMGFLFLIAGLYLVDFDHDGIPYTMGQLGVHILIVVRQWIGYPRIDGISWTLEIELYFYIIMFIFFQYKQNMRDRIIPFSLVLIVSIVYFIPFKIGEHTFWYQKRELLMMAYMLLGYFLYQSKHREKTLMLGIFFYMIIMAAIYSFFIHTKPFSVYIWGWYFPYLTAPILFYSAIFFFEHYKIDTLSKFLANISYPLYVVHQIFGYALLVYFLKHGYSSWFALVIVLFIVFVISYIIHVLIEKPALKYAQKFNHKNELKAIGKKKI